MSAFINIKINNDKKCLYSNICSNINIILTVIIVREIIIYVNIIDL